MKTGRRSGKGSEIVSACRIAADTDAATGGSGDIQHRRKGLAWCSGASVVMRRVPAIEGMGVTRFDLVISSVLDSNPSMLSVTVGGVGSDDGGGLGRLLHGVSARLHCDAYIEASPVREARRAGLQAYMSGFASFPCQDQIRSPAVAALSRRWCNDVTSECLKFRWPIAAELHLWFQLPTGAIVPASLRKRSCSC